MKRVAWWNPRLGPLSLCVLLLVAHLLLKEGLSHFDVVSCIFAAGTHVPLWMLVCAALFIVLRLAVYLLVPALLAWYVATALVGRLIGRKQNQSTAVN